MKKLFSIFIIILFYSLNTYSQKERLLNRPNFDNPKFHYGFYLGINKNDFRLDYKPSSLAENPNITVEADYGFNVGLIGDIRLHRNVNIRFEPGLISNVKKITFNHVDGEQPTTREAGSTFLHLPVILKFSTNRLNNIRPYVLGGLSYDYNFSSNEQNVNDNSSGEFRMRSSNFMYQVGIGIDLYLGFFKLSPSIRGIFAINNELKHDNTATQFTDPIYYLGTRGVFLHFSFEG